MWKFSFIRYVIVIPVFSDHKYIVINLLFPLYCYIRCCCCLLIIIVRSSCLRSKENLNHHQYYPHQAVLVVLRYLFLLLLLVLLVIIIMYHPHHLPLSPHNVTIIKKSNVNNEMKKIPIILDHHVPNNFLVISVVAAIIYVRAHVNVPFHQIHFKMIMLRQHLIEKIARVHRQLIHPTIVVKNFEVFIDFILSTDHLRRYISERRLLERKNNKTFLPKLSLLVLLFSSLFPLAIASTLPPTQITTANRDVYIDFGLNSSSITFSLSRKAQWHAGCCIRSTKASLTVCTASLNTTLNETNKNNLIEKIYHIDFLNNEELFCKRYSAFRHLSSHHLAIFTYTTVIVGIIFNSFVFLVLMCGSLRRSTSFTLFLALTCFDLLSLASSLFALLFRTVMTYLKTSAPFCKMFGIFFLYFRQCSSTTLLLIAIERCIVIKYPFCRHTFDKFRLPLLAFIMFIFVVPIPFDFIFYTSGSLHCEAIDSTQAHLYQIFRGFFTVFTYAMVPFVGICISNFLIIMELKKSRKRFMTKDENGTMRRFSTK
jgi:hypothetical protein